MRLCGVPERLALVGLLQIAGVGAGLYLMHEASEPRRHAISQMPALMLAETASDAWDDSAELHERLAAKAQLLRAKIEVRDALNRPLWATGKVSSDRPPITRMADVTRDGRTVGRIHLSMCSPRSLPSPLTLLGGVAIALGVVGLGTLVLSRLVVRPLDQLTGAARRFGEGDMTVRSGLSSSDEIGELAQTFDAMAGRVQELLRSQAELVAGVSHELRTPLARIRVSLDLAQEGAMLEREVIEEVGTDLEELECLVEEMLLVARLRLTDQRAVDPLTNMPRVALDLRDVAAASVERFRARHQAVPLLVEMSNDPIWLKGASMLLRRAVDNVLDNAARHADGAEVALHCAVIGEQACIEVHDCGRGMAPEDLARAFEPFFRADPSRARASGGLGLGLTLVRRIAEAHGGTVAMDSQPGQGTTARMTFPTISAPRA